MRPDRWEDRLVETIELYRNRPFEWGVTDCVTFAADCVFALLQTRDHYPLFEGKYTDARSYLQLVEDIGGFERGLEYAKGRKVPIGLSQRGDVVVVDNFEGRTMLTVNIGDGKLACSGEDGLVFRYIDDYAEIRHAWRFE